MRISDWSSDVCASDLHDPVHRLRPEGMLAAGDQADKVACQAEACDLAPSVRQQLEQPQRPDRHIVDVPHGVAFTEQRTTRPEKIGRATCRERVCQYV